MSHDTSADIGKYQVSAPWGESCA